jgi:hypothetical protein
VNPVHPKPAPRLGTIHLLGWMLGCGIVLAVYRFATTGMTLPLSVQIQQLGFGLAYGTALSGLALYVWRWRTGSGPGPTQPGHWLLLFCGVGFLIDIAVGGAILSLGMLFPRWAGRPLYHQALGWWVGTTVDLAVLPRMKGASRLWLSAATSILFVISMNAVFSTVLLIVALQGMPGTWPWYYVCLARIAGMIPLICIWTAAIDDARQRLPRDWLHVAGIFAVSLLGLVDVCLHLYWIRLYR